MALWGVIFSVVKTNHVQLKTSECVFEQMNRSEHDLRQDIV